MGRKTGKSIFVPEESSGLCLDPFDHHGGLGTRLSRCSRQESRDCTPKRERPPEVKCRSGKVQCSTTLGLETRLRGVGCFARSLRTPSAAFSSRSPWLPRKNAVAECFLGSECLPPRTWHRSGYRTGLPEYERSPSSCLESCCVTRRSRLRLSVGQKQLG